MKKRTIFFCFMLSALMIVMSSVTVFAADSEESSLSATLATAEKVSGMVSVSAPYPFEFIVSTTNENTAFISFVPDVDTDYTFYLGVKGERQEIFKINRTQYMVEAGVEYSFAYSYTVGDDMTVYNGTLLVTADDAGITVTPTGVVRNITYAGDITEAVKASYFAANTRAAGTANESESNNTMATADITYDGYDSYGTLSSTSDVDWWKVSFSITGTASFWLGNIPSGCNYDISVYSQAGMLLGESYNSGTTAELVQVDVTAGTFYYIKVESTTNASSSQYLLRANYNLPSSPYWSFTLYSGNISTRYTGIAKVNIRGHYDKYDVTLANGSGYVSVNSGHTIAFNIRATGYHPYVLSNTRTVSGNQHFDIILIPAGNLAASTGFTAPFDSYYVLSPFGWRSFNGNGAGYYARFNKHNGVDLPKDEGTEIKSICDVASYEFYNGFNDDEGNFVRVVDSETGYTIRYKHQYSLFGENQVTSVSQGERIGYVGNTGDSDGAHLHIEINDSQGKFYEPMLLWE